MKDTEIKNKLRTIIEHSNLHDVIQIIAEICFEFSDDYAKEGDNTSAEFWDSDGKKLDRVYDQLDN
jgi:hypothetical protein